MTDAEKELEQKALELKEAYEEARREVNPIYLGIRSGDFSNFVRVVWKIKPVIDIFDPVLYIKAAFEIDWKQIPPKKYSYPLPYQLAFKCVFSRYKSLLRKGERGITRREKILKELDDSISAINTSPLFSSDSTIQWEDVKLAVDGSMISLYLLACWDSFVRRCKEEDKALYFKLLSRLIVLRKEELLTEVRGLVQSHISCELV